MSDEIKALSEDAPLYEQQPEEPVTHFAWFNAYLVLGPRRSLRTAYKIFYAKASKSPKKPQLSATWKTTAIRWSWRERAGAWDREQLAKDRDSALDTLDKMRTALSQAALRKLEISGKLDALPLMESGGTGPNGEFILVPAKWDRNTSARYDVAAVSSAKAWCELWGFRNSLKLDEVPDEDILAQLTETLRKNGATVEAPWENASEEDDNDED